MGETFLWRTSALEHGDHLWSPPATPEAGRVPASGGVRGGLSDKVTQG